MIQEVTNLSDGTNNVREQDLTSFLLGNYLPYAKSTIVERAIPFIDGLKPVQRRVLYSMYSLGLINGKNMKSARIVGDTMGKYHPHGDSSIYGTLVLMTDKYEGLNVPYITGHGSFGKKWTDIGPASMRYTEAKLAPICKELVDGLNENAVDMIPNYDNSLKEPVLLPVKFPNVIVNNDSGVAVGISSYIPTFSLKNACSAVQAILTGKATKASDLVDVLGVPEFPSGGHVHTNDKELATLCEKGHGTFKITGDVEVYSNCLIITQLPYGVTSESFMESIKTAMQEGKKLQGIKDVHDEIGIHGLRIVLPIRSGYKSRDVLRELLMYTPFKTKISFRSRVIIDNKPVELGVYELLNKWIDFRQGCIKRVNEYRLVSIEHDEFLASAWEKIYDHITEVVAMISSHKYDDAKALLMKEYGLAEEQATYLLELKLKVITRDRAAKEIEKLEKLREQEKDVKETINSIDKRYRIICDEQQYIIDKYATANKTVKAPELDDEELKPQKYVPSDELAVVVYTANGYLKRFTSGKYMQGETYTADNGDEEILRWYVKNNEYMLAFDRFGYVHKILVDDIEQSRGVPKDLLARRIGVENTSDVIYLDAAGDYTKHFNIIYLDGKGVQVRYDVAEGKRSKYKCRYPEVAPGKFFLTLTDKFFLVTQTKKAVLCNIDTSEVYGSVGSFRAGRAYKADAFVRLLPFSGVPYPDKVDFSKYMKGYAVKIGDDLLEYDPEYEKRVAEAKAAMELECKRMNGELEEEGEYSSENSNEAN